MKRAHPIIAALAQIRHQAGTSQRAVAAEAHVSDKSLSNWELGASVPTVADAARVAEALGYRLTLVKNTPEAPTC